MKYSFTSLKGMMKKIGVAVFFSAVLLLNNVVHAGKSSISISWDSTHENLNAWHESRQEPILVKAMSIPSKCEYQILLVFAVGRSITLSLSETDIQRLKAGDTVNHIIGSDKRKGARRRKKSDFHKELCHQMQQL